MAEEQNNHNNDFKFFHIDYIAILAKWLNEFENIKNNQPDNIKYDSFNDIKNLIKTLIALLKNNQHKIPNYYISFIEKSIKNITELQKNNQNEKIEPILLSILEHLLSLKNIISLDSLEIENNIISTSIQTAKQNLESTNKILDSTNNILALINLKGLAAEFELQYNQYNAERKFWGISIIILLLAIICRTANIKVNPIDASALLFYIIIFLLLSIWVTPDSFKKLTNLFLRNKHFSTFDALQKYISRVQIMLFLILIEFVIMIFFMFTTRSLSSSDLILFSVTLYKVNYNDLHDLLPSLSIYIPLIWALWFSVKQYHYTLKLMNAYRFKMALSLAYNGYKKECDELGNTDHKEHLMHEVLTVVADDPTKRDFKDTHMPWAEVKEIFNIVNKNK